MTAAKDARDALHELLAATGLTDPGPEAVQIAGSDPVVSTRYKVGAAGAAAQAAIGVAISEVWKERTGRPQRASVDAGDVAIALKGRTYTSLDGKPLASLERYDPWDDERAPRFLYYPVRGGGSIRLQMSYPHLRDVVLATLGSPVDVAAAMKASAEWDGVELEDAVHAAGGCAGLVRTSDEWTRHPQSAAVAAQPLIEIARIGGAPAEPFRPGGRPLSGVRVLDLTRVVAGPACARTLAEHGADVLKINSPTLPHMGVGELDSGLGKRSAFLDLATAAGARTLRELSAGADVFCQGYRPGSLASRGFSPEDVAKLRPGIVYVELSAWGSSGPWSGRRGYDPTIQSVSGMAHESRDAAGPVKMPVSAIDYLAGYLMALGTIVALRRRASEGGSWLVRTSLARAGKWLVDLGTLGDDEIASAPAEPDAAAIERLSTETGSPAGRVRHLRPVLELSETPPRWERPPVPVGFNQPSWRE